MAVETKMKVTGLSQYKANIKSAQQSVKQLDAELKLAAAEYQNTGDKEAYAGKQTDLLTKQIQQQERVVASQKAALQAMQQQGIDPSNKAYQQMQLQMTQAQTKLVTMQSTLNGSNAKFKDGTKQVGEYQSALSSINTKVSFDAVIGGIDSIGGALENGVRKVARFAKELFKFEAGATVWADDIITEAKRAGVSIEDYQRMQYAEQIVDTDFEDIVKGVDKVRKATEKGFVMLDDSGLATRSVKMGKDSLENFWAVVEAIQKLPTEGQKAEAAMKIFGKSYRELGTLFDEGARANWEAAMAEAPIVSEDGVKQLGEANDALVTMQAEFEKLKTELAVDMAPIFKDVTKALTAMMKEFSEWLKSDEGQEAIQKLKDGFQWLIDNKETVVDAIKYIAVTLATLKVSEGVLKFLQMINGVKGLFGGGKATASAAPAAASAAGGAVKLGFGDFLTGAAMAAVIKKTVDYSKQAIGYSRASAADAMWADATTVTGWTAEQRAAYEDYFDAVRASHGVIESSEKSVKEAEDALATLFADDKDFNGMSEQLVKLDKVIENLGLWDSTMEDLPDELFQDMKDAADAVTAGLTSQMGVFYSAGQAIAAAIQSGVSSVAMPRQSGMRNVVSNLYINTMNMAQNNVKQLVNAISNNLSRTQYAYGGSGGGF